METKLSECEHRCISNCRRTGCNNNGCTCGGEWHCEFCKGKGFVEKTEWAEVDGKDMSYDVAKKCECCVED